MIPDPSRELSQHRDRGRMQDENVVHNVQADVETRRLCTYHKAYTLCMLDSLVIPLTSPYANCIVTP